MIEIKAPGSIPNLSKDNTKIFLTGSIEMGVAEEWQEIAKTRLDWILMYFDPATKSPISLLELGLFANSGKLVVVCPDAFWRKGNVDIVCDTYQIMQQDTLMDACDYIVEQENLKRAK